VITDAVNIRNYDGLALLGKLMQLKVRSKRKEVDMKLGLLRQNTEKFTATVGGKYSYRVTLNF
jgi:hypothetical protein